MADTRTLAVEFSIGSDHPALPGHFPGAPIVPGVVLLDRVRTALAQQGVAAVSGIASAKFVRAVQPEEPVTLQIEMTPTRARFQARVGAEPAFSGEFLLNSPTHA